METIDTHALKLTPSAIARVEEILAADGGDHAALRVAVVGGGCSGFQYKFSVEHDAPSTEDLVIREGNAVVLVDDISLPFLQNAELDFTETLAESAFHINNPNSTANCGCGTSFSIA